MSVRIGPDKQGKLVASLNERLGLLQSDMAGRATAFDNAVQQILSSFTAANPGAEGHFLRIADELWKQAEQARLYEAGRARETQRREALRGFETDFELFVLRPVREALPSPEQSRALSETVRADAQRFLAGRACDLPWMPLGDGFAEPVAELAGLAPERLAELFPSEHGIRCSYGAKVTALGCNLVRQGRLSAFGTWRGQVISLPPAWFKDWARVQACQPVVLVSTAEAQRWAETGQHGGPLSGGERRRESRAAAFVLAFTEARPGARMTKGHFRQALAEAAFTGKAADRIWDAAAPEMWKSGRRPGKDILRILPNDLVVALGEARI